jgi:hypothetical protein
MPKKLLWKETSKLKFNNNNELKDWYSKSLEAIVKHCNEVSCQCCTAVENHKMKDIRLICNRNTCNNENRLCDVKYKILRCCNKNKYTVYQIGDHVNNNEENVDKSSKRGIQHYVKDLIDDLIFERDISTPKKIHIKLNGIFLRIILIIEIK